MHTDNTHSRLFLALPIPEAISKELSAFADAYLPSQVRHIAPEHYHITLHFLGDVDKKMQNTLEAAITAGTWPCINEIRVNGTGAFPHILYAAIAQNVALDGFQQSLTPLLEKVGITPETRPYTPHITLARTKRMAATEREEWLDAGDHLPALYWQPTHVCLYESHLSDKGAVYEILRQWPLVDG